ncbi:recombinase family protein [Phenylobacterium sp.]|uniref:recombinase family protein n=1 Tax=Phenylobacterium sp. TaxID=1871053 RepID=UPI002616892B|nr:recombinase family protein [Phenylobacterium sp.]
MSRKSLRCAIYTRKSSEEGLEQGFNSLHAQREACEAYVLSQAGEGWIALPAVYDDGGYSGGSIERPALTRLLADIAAGKIDVVVVYKVDRLTRSLSDFARIVEIFDERQVSFVSVTQAFNTTSSMGRLTLNVLLSFAQFEREVTGERIRDKIAASKAKGLWMGGSVPLGYDLPTEDKNRVLVVNEAEAKIVRHIFQRYLDLGSVRELAEDLRVNGVTSKRRVTLAGKVVGGLPFRDGALYYLLRNRTYRGEIPHKDKVYPGQHPAIVPEDLFAQVQKGLEEGNRRQNQSSDETVSAALAGKLFDDRGHAMSPLRARRGGRTYRYYVSQAALRRDRGEPGSLRRAPAYAVEALVAQQLAARGDGTEISRVTLSANWVELRFLGPAPHDAEAEGEVVRLPVNLVSRGGAKQIVTADGTPVTPVEPDEALLRTIARARRWEAQLISGERSGADDIAAAEGVQGSFVAKVLKLAWMAPDLVEALLEGRRPRNAGLGDLMLRGLSIDWGEQRTTLGIR